MAYSKEVIDHFWSNVDFFAKCTCHSFFDNCWLWTMAKTTAGYGHFSIRNEKGKYKHHSVHRLAYELQYKIIPKDMYILHYPPCTTRHCVRHIYCGTPQDNMLDAVSMGEHIEYFFGQGEHNIMATITAKEVIAIREDFKTGKYSQMDLVRKYNRKPMHIHDVVRYKKWKHLP